MRAYCSVGEVYFSFKHYNPESPFTGIDGHPTKAFTMCVLQVEGQTTCATAWCSIGDNFNKEAGRKIALKRAMQHANLNRDDRREVWMAYFGRKNHAKWPNLHLGEGFGYNSWEAAV